MLELRLQPDSKIGEVEEGAWAPVESSWLCFEVDIRCDCWWYSRSNEARWSAIPCCGRDFSPSFTSRPLARSLAASIACLGRDHARSRRGSPARYLPTDTYTHSLHPRRPAPARRYRREYSGRQDGIGAENK